MEDFDIEQGITSSGHGGVNFFTVIIILSFFVLIIAGFTLKQPEATAVAPVKAGQTAESH